MKTTAVRAYVGLGANLGDARAQVSAALEALAACDGLQLAGRSSLYRSAPVDAGGPDYVNAVAALDSRLSPLALLHTLQALEARFGRERPYPNAPRTLDLDLLLYGDTHLATPELTLPHPRLHLRAFVLQPLAELVPDLVLPGHGPVQNLLPTVAEQAIERLP
ncbi:2-amino-4-hydroxy-6-hydroxymethyldihydropteridine diphosphokinase [Ideonella sp.]|uniref:2-amino-4-hydroxy-6- hydroxymethyldihydropteridine diphosphokinase n=1 Tax=Ideonella sp. TaxID=1929293 RepID=UPI0035AE6B3E